jgi:RNA polymerase sigma-70 factor (ECF subfamily)
MAKIPFDESELPASSESTSLTLLERAKAHDSEAWRRLVRIYGPFVYSWARHAGLQESDATDVAQEVLSTVVVRIPDFQREDSGDTFRGWLWGITRNKLLEFYRRQQKNPRAIGGSEAGLKLDLLEALPAGDSGELNLDQVKTALVQQARDLIRSDFDEKTWRAFWRMAVDGRKATEVAQELSMSADAVRQAKCRVLRRLRHELSGLL